MKKRLRCLIPSLPQSLATRPVVLWVPIHLIWWKGWGAQYGPHNPWGHGWRPATALRSTQVSRAGWDPPEGSHSSSFCREVGIGLFSHMPFYRTRGNRLMLCQRRFRLDIGKNFFTRKARGAWPGEMWDLGEERGAWIAEGNDFGEVRIFRKCWSYHKADLKQLCEALTLF